MSIIKQGWTEKCGPKHCPTWYKRWLVLYDTRVLEYFVNDTKNELKGEIELSGVETIKFSGDSGKSFANGFYLKTPSRTYKFAVSSNREKNEWCELIKQVIDGDIRRNKTKIKKKRGISTAIQSLSNHSSPINKINKKRAQSTPANHFNLSQINESIEAKSIPIIYNHCNDDVALFNLGNDYNSILIKIIDYLHMNKYEFSKLFLICKLFRDICINNAYFFRYYTIHVYPQHILSRFSSKRNASNRWILNHAYREIWIFGNVEHYKYCQRNVSLSPYFGPLCCNKLFIDDALLWGKDTNISDIMRFIEFIALNIRFVHIRCYESDSIFIESLPILKLVDSVRLDFRFHRDLFCKSAPCLNAENLIYLELHRVDLISDESIDDICLRVCFKQLTKLLVLSIIDSRWKNCIVLPPQIKFFRFKPGDLSIIDMSRIANKLESTQNKLSYKVNWPCDMIVNHNNWPSVMNQYIMAGHEALQNKKLRIWVLRHLRKWDKILMNVNYCQYPPPFHLFKKAKCFKRLTQLDQNRDMSHIWSSRKAKYWRQEKW